MIASLTLKHQTAQLKMFGPASINSSNTITLHVAHLVLFDCETKSVKVLSARVQKSSSQIDVLMS